MTSKISYNFGREDDGFDENKLELRTCYGDYYAKEVFNFRDETMYRIIKKMSSPLSSLHSERHFYVKKFNQLHPNKINKAQKCHHDFAEIIKSCSHMLP